MPSPRILGAVDDVSRYLAQVGHSITLPRMDAAATADELALIHRIRRTSQGLGLDRQQTAWANLLAGHGGTDLWLDLTRVATAHMSAADAKKAVELLNQTRTEGWRLGTAAKALIERKRPFHEPGGPTAVVHEPRDFSFPSSHTLAAFAQATVLGAFDPAHAREYRWLAREVASSRVYGGVHYETDVQAGAQLGIWLGEKILSGAGMAPTAAARKGADLIGEPLFNRLGTSRDRITWLVARVHGARPSVVTPPAERTPSRAIDLLAARYDGLGPDWQRHPREATHAIELPPPPRL